jgi:hypothetical protein
MAKIQRTVEVEGGRYKNKATGEIVTAICWKKDGDHPLVVRYPIEKRNYKGLLEISPKEKYAFVYGDWIVETEAEAVYVVKADVFGALYEEVKEEPA